jgi:hypothetical protein
VPEQDRRDQEGRIIPPIIEIFPKVILLTPRPIDRNYITRSAAVRHQHVARVAGHPQLQDGVA